MRCGSTTRSGTSGSWAGPTCCCPCRPTPSPAVHRWAGVPGPPTGVPTCWPSPRSSRCTPASPSTPVPSAPWRTPSSPPPGPTRSGGWRSTPACPSRRTCRRGSSRRSTVVTCSCPDAPSGHGPGWSRRAPSVLARSPRCRRPTPVTARLRPAGHRGMPAPIRYPTVHRYPRRPGVRRCLRRHRATLRRRPRHPRHQRSRHRQRRRHRPPVYRPRRRYPRRSRPRPSARSCHRRRPGRQFRRSPRGPWSRRAWCRRPWCRRAWCRRPWSRRPWSRRPWSRRRCRPSSPANRCTSRGSLSRASRNRHRRPSGRPGPRPPARMDRPRVCCRRSRHRPGSVRWPASPPGREPSWRHRRNR
jgi:hypothetical protein